MTCWFEPLILRLGPGSSRHMTSFAEAMPAVRATILEAGQTETEPNMEWAQIRGGFRGPSRKQRWRRTWLAGAAGFEPPHQNRDR
jgi:hypothetical protein